MVDALEAGRAFVDLSSWRKVGIGGGDALTWLNDLVSANIDGLTPEQRFFLAWAQIWRNKATDPYLRNQVVTDPHAPARWRVMGPLSNLKEFTEAFGCKNGDPMVRADSVKATIW